MEFVYNDGGREKAGYKGDAGDCVTRSIAIALDKPYQEVYDAINELAKQERFRHKRRSSARNGVFRKTKDAYLFSQGCKWTPTMFVGKGCKVHLKAEELPMGRLIVNVSRHEVTVIDHVIHDTHDPSKDGTRCVYGYWTVPAKEKTNENQSMGTSGQSNEEIV